jgi:threonine/homoserine/homoserine lactone efflux protein
VGQAIGQNLPVAVGVALSPFPVIAMVLMQTTPRARTNGPAFLAGWLLGLAVVGTVVLLAAAASGAGADGRWASWLKVLLGVLLLRLAVRQVHGRLPPGDHVQVPRWMGAVDRFTPAQSVFTGATLTAADPKNLLLAIGAAATITQAGIPGVPQAIAYAVFVVIGTVGVAAPVVLHVARRKRSAAALILLDDWMGRHNAAIVSVLCLVIGVQLIGDEIGALT